VGITGDTEFRQMHHGDITTMTVDSISLQPRHFKADAPLVLPRII
jgi:hypothetical protein